MSFLQSLNERANASRSPQAALVPISLPAASGGLADTVREPYRVNAPLNSTFTPTTQLPPAGRPIIF